MVETLAGNRGNVRRNAFVWDSSLTARSPRRRDVPHDYVGAPNFERQRAFWEGYEVRRVGGVVWAPFGVVVLYDRIHA